MRYVPDLRHICGMVSQVNGYGVVGALHRVYYTPFLWCVRGSTQNVLSLMWLNNIIRHIGKLKEKKYTISFSAALHSPQYIGKQQQTHLSEVGLIVPCIKRASHLIQVDKSTLDTFGK